jgi:hypothetical protein
MTDQNENVAPPKLISRIIITFAEPDSVKTSIIYENVSPLQVQAAGFLLEQGAIENISAMQKVQREKAELAKIAVPGQFGGKIP